MNNIKNTDKQTCSMSKLFFRFPSQSLVYERNVAADTLRIKVPTYISVCITL